ncbi:MAG TPA: radical SAM protein [Chitinophagales bacterium]|nr:radical SAM protein [Chitinophagales bacterium]
MNKVLLFNPRSNDYKARIPNSVLQVATCIDHQRDWVIVDGNLETDPQQKIINYLNTGEFAFFGCTVMPGPQLRQAIPITKLIHEQYPSIKIIWGGYFASNQYKSVINSGYVDAIINGPGDFAFPKLLLAFENNEALDGINNLICKRGDEIIITQKDSLFDQDLLADMPYDKLNKFYPVERYLGKSYLGTKTIAYHSSFGCPFTCSFCAVVPIYNAKWRGQSAEKIYRNIKHLRDVYGGNAIEFHDNNFFVNEKRTVEFAKLVMNDNMVWWGEGRIDTIDKYSDESLAIMRDSGCKMIFFGAETGNDAILKKMDKGGKQTGAQILAFAERMKKFDIIPEYSFVLGTPGDSPEQVMQQIDEDIAFINKVKQANPNTEIIIYVYSPVPTEDSDMYKQVLASGFRFPEKLEDWLAPLWEKFDLRKNPLTPWLTAEMVDKIKNFETVLNGYYPTVTDVRLSPSQRRVMKAASTLRFKNKWYKYPYEIKVLQKALKYRQPEVEGF